MRELHLSRRSRMRYGVDATLFAFDGRVIFADFAAARGLAQRIAVHPETVAAPPWPPTAGALNSMGLLDELLHAMLEHYRRTVAPTLLDELMATLEEGLGASGLGRTLVAFVDEFPPRPVYAGEMTAAEYLEDPGRRQAVVEELVLLSLGNRNPAYAPYRELFDDRPLAAAAPYRECVELVARQLGRRPGLPGAAGGGSLLELLEEPMNASPHSLRGQLDYVRERWAPWLGESVRRLLGALDLLAEESRPWFPPGPGPVEVPVFGPGGVAEAGEPDAPAAYSADLDWMPRLVLLAKNVHVWLAQLSASYQRPIDTLDRIPDRELDLLAKWGISGLWLIGVWERSRASERIKRMMGDHEAVASAYSLLDYTIAATLGGEAAFHDLKQRALARGIRMATDMVPNHVGIDSRWVVEHPDWFVAVDHPPFPSYRFNGPDLCDDERVGIYLEDHYYDRSDAAVVFKRRDHWTGSERYIYHGNDGTSMPWNDTAQLDYRRPDVREAVIQTILHVARLSPVIRFDAAMTLAKKHYQRLWFPEPGRGGDIPSRAEHAMTRAEFDRVMPQEFWREVVDRVAAEAPDTLLLAEAFWLLEGYFVRTLGMHRVYNSAFMNMLRDERNAEYRQLIKNTLEFDPQILKRYVNFMSNPDEETAIGQFGSGDKYFGVATLMATLPGLPMFGHGQIEGLSEKYGMEFRRPRWQEEPDSGLVARHERQLFPLLKRRRLFAEVEHFLLFDLEGADGSVDENVIAFSNRRGGECALVVYHNRFGDTRGRLRLSTAVRAGDHGELARFTLAHGLGLEGGRERWVVLREAVRQEEWLLPSRQLVEQGFELELFAYELRVFLDIRELADDADGRYRRVWERLGGRPTPSVERELREIELAPLLDALRELVNGEWLGRLLAAWREDDPVATAATVAACALACADAVTAVEAFLGAQAAPEELTGAVAAELATLLATPVEGAAEVAPEHDDAVDRERAELLGWVLLHHLRPLSAADAADWFDAWLLRTPLEEALRDAGMDPALAARTADTVGILCALEDALTGEAEAGPAIAEVLEGDAARRFLGVNRFAGTTWYRGDAMDELVVALERLSPVLGDRQAPVVRAVRAAAAAAEYHHDALIELLRRDAPSAGGETGDGAGTPS